MSFYITGIGSKSAWSEDEEDFLGKKIPDSAMLVCMADGTFRLRSWGHPVCAGKKEMDICIALSLTWRDY